MYIIIKCNSSSPSYIQFIPLSLFIEGHENSGSYILQSRFNELTIKNTIK